MVFKNNPFKKAEALKMKLKFLIMGESGTGKTYTALEIATRLAEKDGGQVAFVDTEGAEGKARIYAPNFDFDHMTLSGFSPAHYIEAIHAAEKYGYSVLVIDSFSHAWSGPGGILELADKKGWKDAKPEHHKLVQAILSANIHIMGTTRIKSTFEKNNGKIDWNSASIDARQEGEFEYEFDLSALLDHEHNLTIRKSRCLGLPSRYEINALNYDSSVSLLHQWLNAGNKAAHWTEYPAQCARVDMWVESARKKGWDIDRLVGMIEARETYAKPESYIEALKIAKNQPNPPDPTDKPKVDPKEIEEAARRERVKNGPFGKSVKKIIDVPTLANNPEAFNGETFQLISLKYNPTAKQLPSWRALLKHGKEDIGISLWLEDAALLEYAAGVTIRETRHDILFEKPIDVILKYHEGRIFRIDSVYDGIEFINQDMKRKRLAESANEVLADIDKELMRV